MGAYPLFACEDWHGLAGDLGELDGRLASVALVTDPFGNFDEALLNASFDRVLAFKDHFLVDLSRPPESFVSSNHRYKARRALKP